MPGLRKQAEEFCLQLIEALLPGSPNTEMYRQRFSKMTDDEFEKMIEKIEAGEPILDIIIPNLTEHKADMQRIYDVAEKMLDHDFFERVWIPANGEVPGYLTPVKYFVGYMPQRRQAQLLSKKIRIPEHNNTVDDLTGQATGDSKGSRISYPEIQALAAMGLDNSLDEMIRTRGGDERGFAAYKASFERTGGVSLKAIEPYSSGVKSVQAFNAFMWAMQIRSNL
jgi:hypothetical protein